MRITAITLALALVAGAQDRPGRDWFVRPDASGGDGSREKPFADPWQALEKCEAGDAIHVAAGTYTGKMGGGTWALPFDRVRLVGGYDAAFAERDPWKHRTRLHWDKSSKNEPKNARVSSDAKDVVVDGVVIDMRDQNGYVDDACTGRNDRPGQPAMYFGNTATVRNCVIVNPGTTGIDCTPGSTIENNLIVNAMGFGVLVRTSAGAFARMTAVIRRNTIVFSWDPRNPGAGGVDGAAVALRGPATVTENILAHADNNAVYLAHEAGKVSVTKNTFFMNLWSSVKLYVDGRDVVVDHKSMDLLEEVGLRACDGNEVANPELELDAAWMDRFSRRTSAKRGKVEMDDWNKLRQLHGLPLIATGGEAATGVAPAWDLDKALKLLAPRNAAVKAGARVAKLEAKFAGAIAAAPAKAYAKAELAAWYDAPDSVDGRPLEMIVAVGDVANIGSMPATYKQDEIAGVFLYDRAGRGGYVTGFYKKGTSVERACEDMPGGHRGEGVPDRLHLVRGIAYNVRSVPKGAFFIESIERYEPEVVIGAKRPPGRDWFVRAGATGGDGSRDRPFKDPFQALERCESGDTIHVAEGEYAGKLRVGVWKIDVAHVALLGGYDVNFKERNPWSHPSLLHCPADFKGRRGGCTIEGEDDHAGTIVDGFVFDKKLNNRYGKNGDLLHGESDKTEHVALSSRDCVVRNCVFVNGAGGALRVAGGQLVENNIFINHHGQTIDVKGGDSSAPCVIRANTVVFSWDSRFGKGRGARGHLLKIWPGMRAVVRGNIFEFADNDAIQQASDARDVELADNVFAHNLWSHVSDLKSSAVVDDKNWRQLNDIAWKKCGGNERLIPGLPVDEKWFDVYLNRTAYVPGKVEMDDWNKLREILGQPLVAKGAKAAEGMAPAYDWKKALSLFPKNEKCRAGARASNLDVRFDGVKREEPSHVYAETAWEVAASRDEWAKLDGRRVRIKAAIQSTDNQYWLDDVKDDAYQCFLVVGGDGSLPLRCYVKRGTRHERLLKQAKGVSTGREPEEWHVLTGVARKDRQLVVEGIERSE